MTRLRNWWQNFDPHKLYAAFWRWLDKLLCDQIDRQTKDQRKFGEIDDE
jgi:hypothetical protein